VAFDVAFAPPVAAFVGGFVAAAFAAGLAAVFAAGFLVVAKGLSLRMLLLLGG
jgi:hypothetical protein